jgi:hypothetical protein
MFKKYRNLEKKVAKLQEQLDKDNNVRLLKNKDETLKRYKRIVEELRRDYEK